jgi:hypothetical protein
MTKDRLAALDRLDEEVAERLQAAQARVAAAEAELIESKRVRYEVIGEAMAARWSQSRIGEHLGLTKQRVAQIRRARGEDE